MMLQYGRNSVGEGVVWRAAGGTWYRGARPATMSLLVTPCDPGNCHIYFGVQLRALPTAIALSMALKRTLLLPPFEWYENQAQQFANAFRATPQGRTPNFMPWSELFDIERLREEGLAVHTFEEKFRFREPFIDRGLLQTANAIGAQYRGMANREDCKRSSDGLRANVTWIEEGQTAVHAGARARAHLYGFDSLHFGELKCAAFSLAPQHKDVTLPAMEEYFGDASVGAIFNVGHHIASKLDDKALSVMLLERALRPNKELEAEAVRFMQQTHGWEDRMHTLNAAEASGRPMVPAARRVVAVHWRHGDYVAYNLLIPLHSMVKRVTESLRHSGCANAPPEDHPDEAGGGGAHAAQAQAALHTCTIFLMTNCKNASALSEFTAALAPTPVVSYQPDDPRFAHEGRRLVIEQAIASRVHAFVNTPRSAVSELVETMRRSRAREAELERKRRQRRKQPKTKVEL